MRFRILSSDVDGTLLGNPEATSRFFDAWTQLDPKSRPLLAYNSGRLVQDMIDLLATGVLPWPDFIIGGVGTQLYDARTRRPWKAYSRRFGRNWDLTTIARVMASFPGIQPQPAQFIHNYKSSWYWPHASAEQLDSLQLALVSAGIGAKVVYSSLRDLDVIPIEADKGSALAWMAEQLGIPLEEILVAGDTGNDASMFLLPGPKGIVVANAQPELLELVVPQPTYLAKQSNADGVLEGLIFYEVLSSPPPLEASSLRGQETDPLLKMFVTEDAIGRLSTADRLLISEGYQRALIALRKNITPMGFSACSLSDNVVTGTDVNYRSVWSRDGAFTVMATIELEDEDIRVAQKETLNTLLTRISPAGHPPANVRIDSGKPDYSGVGGICAIDGGLWIIIAVYAFVEKTGDNEFLSDHLPALERLMAFLVAQDANFDGLLEIPEAGDWTDLFGRSYHVLYDEVLWYRATVCWGHLRERLGDIEGSVQYHQRAQRIRSQILESFWPRSQQVQGAPPPSFADRQFSLGDTSYLVAELTPFAFNWRCDVLGNLLAFLFHIIDADQARTTFQFLWGVGINRPWPAMNLYPPVQYGDPDWKPYYTVNLLNLPGHYHNGGLWPFIGGLWVSTIHKLGLHDVATNELVQLARLNRLGRNQDWEFNEWAHATTGRPMGKAFQAWSAASFVLACQDLRLTPESS